MKRNMLVWVEEKVVYSQNWLKPGIALDIELISYQLAEVIKLKIAKVIASEWKSRQGHQFKFIVGYKIVLLNNIPIIESCTLKR